MKRLSAILLFLTLMPSLDWAADHAGWTSYSLATAKTHRSTSDSSQDLRQWCYTLASDKSNEMVMTYCRNTGTVLQRVISTNNGSSFDSAFVISTSNPKYQHSIWPIADLIFGFFSNWTDGALNHAYVGKWTGTTFVSDRCDDGDVGGSGGVHVGGFCLSNDTIHVLTYHSGDITHGLRSNGGTLATGTNWVETELVSGPAIWAFGYGQAVPWKNGMVKMNVQGGIFVYNMWCGAGGGCVDTATIDWPYTTTTSGAAVGRLRLLPYGAQENADTGVFVYQKLDGGVWAYKIKIENDGDSTSTYVVYDSIVVIDSTTMPSVSTLSRNRVACPELTWLLNSDGTPTDTCIVTAKKFPDTTAPESPEIWYWKLIWAKGSALSIDGGTLAKDDISGTEIMALNGSPKVWRQADSTIKLWYSWAQSAGASGDSAYIGKLTLTSVPASTASRQIRRRREYGTLEPSPVERFARQPVILDMRLPQEK